MAKPLDPVLIPKFTDQPVIPPVYKPKVIKRYGRVVCHNYTVRASQFTQQILPSGFPETTVWGYGGAVTDPESNNTVENFRSAPGATFEAVRGIPVNVQWVNDITEPHSLPVDPTLYWADPNRAGMPMPPFPPFPQGFPLAQSPVPLLTCMEEKLNRHRMATLRRGLQQTKLSRALNL